MLRQRMITNRLTVVAIALAASAVATPGLATLVFHFDPNDTRTTFQHGFEDNRFGTVPATNIGDPVGWMMDTRVPSVPTPDPDNGQDTYIDGQQGNPDNRGLLAYHPTGTVLNYLDTGNNDNLLVFRGNTGLTDGIGTSADLNLGTLIIAGRIDPAGTDYSYLIDFRDDSPVGGGENAIDGFGLRYNHSTAMLEGIVKQSVAGSVSVPAGDWFVASLAWNGPSETATLNVQTAAGVASDTAAASMEALNPDRLRLANNSAGNSGLLGQLGDILYYNDIDDHSSVATQLANDYLSIAELIVNRETGNVSLMVPTTGGAITNVVGYSITSQNNALNPANWTSIAENYDAGNPGPNQRDPDNQWSELTDASSLDELTEFEFQGNGGVNAGADFLTNSTTNLGNVWNKYHREDLKIELALSNDVVIELPVRFTENGGLAYQFGDLNFSGEIDYDDLLDVLKPNYGMDTSALPLGPARYALGDMDEDGAITLTDFLLLNEAYLSANPGAAALSWDGAQVPEPATWALLLVGSTVLCGRRLVQAMRSVGLALVALLILAPQQSFATIGGVLDVSFEHFTPGTTINDGSRVQDYSGNRYHGFWGDTAALANDTPVELAYPLSHTVINNEDKQGFVILRDDLGDGGLGSPNPWWGEGNTPTPYFSLGANTSYTFEAVLNWNGNDQGNDGIMGFTGGTEWWIRENNGSLEYVFDDGPNRYIRAGAGGIDVAALIDNSDWHHVGITFARDQVTPTTVTITSYIDYQQVDQAVASVPLGEISPGDGDIRLGAYNTNDAHRFDGYLDHFRISDEVLDVEDFLAVPQPPQYVVEINTGNGMVSIVNETGVDLTMDAYRLTSEAGSLDATNWTSLESIDYEGQGPDSGWTELGDSANEISEGFLGGSSDIPSPSTISLGQIYTDLGNEDATLKFEYHAPGAAVDIFSEIAIQFVTGEAVPGDYNGDGTVNAADYALWRDTRGETGAGLAADGNGDNTVDGGDYTYWRQRFGSSGGSGAGQASAVPEPSSMLLLCCIAATLLTTRFRIAGIRLLLVVAGLAIFASTVRADAFADRQYTLGDDPLEGGSAGGFPALTYDSMGVNLSAFPGAINTGAYQDLVVAGAQYVDVGSAGQMRPGAAIGTLGLAFDGVDDRGTTIASLNWPNATWRTVEFFPTGIDLLYDPPSSTNTDGTGDGEYRPAFPHSYAGINQRAMQAWVKPDVAGLDGARQDVLLDTEEHGFVITADNTWGFLFDNNVTDTGVLVTDTLDTNGWVHLMALGGISRTNGNNTTLGGGLLINGEVVASSNAVYDASTAGLSLGSNIAGDGNFFQGTIDDVEMLVWGNNSWRGPGATNQELGYLGGADWGAINAGDNQWMAIQLEAAAMAASVPFIPDADVNLDGVVAGTGAGPAATDDVSAFILAYGLENAVGPIPVGDWNSRQNGDLNFDGVADIRDALMLRDALLAAGSGSFDLGLLAGATVPEPSGMVLATLGLLGTLAWFGKTRLKVIG